MPLPATRRPSPLPPACPTSTAGHRPCLKPTICRPKLLSRWPHGAVHSTVLSSEGAVTRPCLNQIGWAGNWGRLPASQWHCLAYYQGSLYQSPCSGSKVPPSASAMQYTLASSNGRAQWAALRAHRAVRRGARPAEDRAERYALRRVCLPTINVDIYPYMGPSGIRQAPTHHHISSRV